MTHTQRQHVQEDDDHLTVTNVGGFERSVAGTVLCWLLTVCTAGLLRLVLHWRRDWLLLLTHSHCSLSRATSVLLTERYKKYTRRYVRRVKLLSTTACHSYNEWSSSSSPSCPSSSSLPSCDKQECLLSCEHVPATGIAQDNHSAEVKQVRYFRHKRVNYTWRHECDCFVRLAPFFCRAPLSCLHQQQPLSMPQQTARRSLYGDNSIDVHVTPLLKVIFLEVLSPFYVFQVFSCALWYVDEYEFYATAIVIASLVSVFTTVYQQRTNELKLRATIHHCDSVEVLRDNGHVQSVSANELCPGDIIVIPRRNCVVPCDAVLLNGHAIVNESSLTGESVPVTKVAIGNETSVYYNAQQHARHTLFNGTQLIQTRYYRHQHVLALVTRTGFMTCKGQLVRSILYPPPVDFQLERDTYRFVAVLAAVASVGMIYSSITKSVRGRPVSQILLDVLDLVTIVVPPALPYAMAVGVIIGVQRLRNMSIFCISPRSINLAGLVDYVCFDKTGTLTEDGLDLKSIVYKKRVRVTCLADSEHNCDSGDGDLNELVCVDSDTLCASDLGVNDLTTAMACCHSLTNIDGRLTGDPLDLKMFECVGWSLVEPVIDDDETANYDLITPTVVRPPPALSPSLLPDSAQHAAASHNADDSFNLTEALPYEVGIVRQLVFDPALQRMSVLTRVLGDKCLTLYCKGSPEMIISLSLPHTVPGDISHVLASYTGGGHRVLALACRRLDAPRVSHVRAARMTRAELECGLTFVALLVFENKLKPETRPVLTELSGACITSVMVTGDNVLTAVSVARECGLVGVGDTLYCVRVISPHDNSSEWQQAAVSRGSVVFDPVPTVDGGVMERNSSQVFVQSGGDWLFPATTTAGHSFRLVVSGGEFDALLRHYRHTQLMQTIVTHGAVFARMSPRHKQQLIELIKEMGHHVAMCGDGANDCGALKAAHVGISLSTAEASVASSFTAATADVRCVVNVVREGRAALVTAFGVFKYMAGYSLAQFVSVMILYDVDCGLSDLQFLYIDFVMITVFAGLFGLTRARSGPLSARRPPAKLVSARPLLSLMSQVLLLTVAQCVAIWSVRRQSWFLPFVGNEDDDYTSHENFAVYTVSSFQYCVLVAVFSAGGCFRRPLHSNHWLSLALLLNLVFCTCVLVHPSSSLQHWLELSVPPDITWRLYMLLLAVCHALLAFVAEYLVNNDRLARVLNKGLCSLRRRCNIACAIDSSVKTGVGGAAVDNINDSLPSYDYASKNTLCSLVSSGSSACSPCVGASNHLSDVVVETSRL